MAAKGKDKTKMNYQHYIPPVKADANWPSGYKFVLIESMDALGELFKDFVPDSTCFAMDLETSSLDPEEGFIVGVSLAFDTITGYYVPIDHYQYEHNLGRDALDMIYHYMCLAKRVFPFNGKFDFRFWEYVGFDRNNEAHRKNRLNPIGYDMSKVKIYDVSVPCWLSDTNVKMPSLKVSSFHFLGIKQQSFEEATYGVDNFYYVDPEKAAFYAGSDALCTFKLVPVTMPYFKEAKFSGQLDQTIIYPLMHYEQEKIMLDRPLIDTLVHEMEATLEQLEKDIYNLAGRHFNLNSPVQVSQVFQSMGVDTGSVTSSGYMSTGIDLLERLPQKFKEENPILNMFIEYKKLFKQLSSYVSVLKKEHDTKGFLRCNYKTQQVPTGRLATGKDAKNSFFSEINIQSVPKPHPMNYYAVDTGDRNLFDKKQNIIMGFQLFPVQHEKDENGKKVEIDGKTIYGDKCLGSVEGADQHLNIRSIFLPSMYGEEDVDENEWVFVAVDYMAQELRIPANLSREPVWVDAFVNGEDIHRKVAMEMYGKDRYNKEMRKRAKGVNFGILYGLTSKNFAEGNGVSQAEADEFFDNYKSALPTLFAWQERTHRRGKKDGTVYTYFSRPRRVRYYFEAGNPGFGYRTISNTIVQGTASDILKIALIKLWKNLFNHPEWKDHARFITNVHDEADMAVRRKYLPEILPIIVKCMRFELPEWPVTIDVEASIGNSWGNMIPFQYDEGSGIWTPKLND